MWKKKKNTEKHWKSCPAALSNGSKGRPSVLENWPGPKPVCMGSTDKAQTGPRQINDWLTKMWEPLSWCCWQLCQRDHSCGAQLLLTIQGNCFLLEKLQKGKTSVLYFSSSSGDLTLLRSWVKSWLKESMEKVPREEEQCCSPRLTLVILNPDQHSTGCSRFPGGAAGRKGGTVWGGRKCLFVAPCISLACQKNLVWFAGSWSEALTNFVSNCLGLRLCCREAAPETAPSYSQGEKVFAFKFW